MIMMIKMNGCSTVVLELDGMGLDISERGEVKSKMRVIMLEKEEEKERKIIVMPYCTMGKLKNGVKCSQL